MLVRCRVVDTAGGCNVCCFIRLDAAMSRNHTARSATDILDGFVTVVDVTSIV